MAVEDARVLLSKDNDAMLAPLEHEVRLGVSNVDPGPPNEVSTFVPENGLKIHV